MLFTHNSRRQKLKLTKTHHNDRTFHKFTRFVHGKFTHSMGHRKDGNKFCQPSWDVEGSDCSYSAIFIFTITAEIHARSLVNFYRQYADRHMNLKFM